MNVAELGNSIYQTLKDDPRAIAQIRAEAKSLALSLATDPNAASQITNATVNGQTFSTKHGMTQSQRLQLLRWVIKCADNCSSISSTAITYF